MFIIQNDYSDVSYDTVRDFEESLKDNPHIRLVVEYDKRHYKQQRLIYRVLKKLNIGLFFKIIRKKYLSNPLKDKYHHFTMSMGPCDAQWGGFAAYPLHVKSIFLFDAWPDAYSDIVSLCDTYKMDFLFITSKQSTERLRQRLPRTCVSYIPEAIRLETYRFKDYKEKTIDVLALGRKWDEYHNLIVGALEKRGYTYLYEKVKGEIVFPNRQSFVGGLAKTKISICVPSNITHPGRAGDVETMTVRYLESMASKCLILGVAPKEMVELFGYNPIVEIDMKKPTDQIVSILQNFEMYIPLIERNYVEVAQKHTWKNRFEQMKTVWDNADFNYWVKV